MCGSLYPLMCQKNIFSYNLKHTEQVVEACKEILSGFDLTEKEKEQLLVAAWFHDTGYYEGAEGQRATQCKTCT